MHEGGPSVKNFISDFLGKELNNFLHKNPSVAEALKKRIEQTKGKKGTGRNKKLANERAKKANLHNKKLRDCRFHLNDLQKERTKTLFLKSKRKVPFLLPKG
jgi:topoisomerase-4 subunit B